MRNILLYVSCIRHLIITIFLLQHKMEATCKDYFLIALTKLKIYSNFSSLQLDIKRFISFFRLTSFSVGSMYLDLNKKFGSKGKIFTLFSRMRLSA